METIKKAGDKFGLKNLEEGSTVVFPRKEGQTDTMYAQNASSIVSYYNRKFGSKKFWRSVINDGVIVIGR